MDVLADHLYFALRLVPNFVARLIRWSLISSASSLCSRLVTLVTNQSLTKRSAHSSRLYSMPRLYASKRKRAWSSPAHVLSSRHSVNPVWTNNLNNRRQLSKKTPFRLSEAQNVNSPLKYHSKRRWVGIAPCGASLHIGKRRPEHREGVWSPPSETREGL